DDTGAQAGRPTQATGAPARSPNGDQMMSAKKTDPAAPSLKDRADNAIGTARQRAVAAYDNARESAAGATRKAGDQLGEAPLAVLAGGIAAGAILSALLPTSRRERDLLAPVTDNIR